MWRYIWSKILNRWAVSKVPETNPAVAKLVASLRRAIENKAWASRPDGTTFCNEFCQQIAHDFGCHDLDGLEARQTGERILAEIEVAGDSVARWQEVTPQKAVETAKGGHFVLGWAPIYTEAHGHVVVVAPEDMEDSGTFGGQVPMCASIAKYPFENRIMKISEAYRVANKPRFFAWLG